MFGASASPATAGEKWEPRNAGGDITGNCLIPQALISGPSTGLLLVSRESLPVSEGKQQQACSPRPLSGWFRARRREKKE